MPTYVGGGIATHLSDEAFIASVDTLFSSTVQPRRLHVQTPPQPTQSVQPPPTQRKTVQTFLVKEPNSKHVNKPKKRKRNKLPVPEDPKQRKIDTFYKSGGNGTLPGIQPVSHETLNPYENDPYIDELIGPLSSLPLVGPDGMSPELDQLPDQTAASAFSSIPGLKGAYDINTDIFHNLDAQLFDIIGNNEELTKTTLLDVQKADGTFQTALKTGAFKDVKKAAQDLFLKSKGIVAFDFKRQRLCHASPESIALMSDEDYTAFYKSLNKSRQYHLQTQRDIGKSIVDNMLKDVHPVPVVSNIREVKTMTDRVLSCLPRSHFKQMIHKLSSEDKRVAQKERRKAMNRRSAYRYNLEQRMYILSLLQTIRLLSSNLKLFYTKYIALFKDKYLGQQADTNGLDLVELEDSLRLLFSHKAAREPIPNESRKKDNRKKQMLAKCPIDTIAPQFYDQ